MRAALTACLAAAVAGCHAPRAAPRADPAPLEPAFGCPARPPPAQVLGGPVALFAAPAGAGEACSAEAPCALPAAFARLGAVSGALGGDVRVVLAGGTYRLDAPLLLCEDGTAHGSGTNGFRVIVEAAPGTAPVLSGGRRLGPWSPAPGRPGVFRAAAPGLRTRQLFVDGVRAVRARAVAAPGQYARTPSGFLRLDGGLLGAGDLRGLEVVDRTAGWRTFRCPVVAASPVAGSFTALALAEPCWENSQGPFAGGEVPFEEVTWIENALALLDTPGEWYLDEAEGQVYYAPRPGESLDTAEVIAPVLETLLWASGGADPSGAPAYLHDVTLRGLAFRHTTWLAPGGPDGFADYQAGFRRVGENRLAAMPAALTLARARRVEVERCTFSHLGGAGLAVQAGSKDVALSGNAFADVSGSAIQAGDVALPLAGDDLGRTTGLAVSNNLVRAAAAEYEGAVGIFLGHAAGSRIEHNEVGALPYTGISAGWGWAHAGSGWASANRLAANHVHDVMAVLHDGGGLYLLGPQPLTTVEGNWVERSGGMGLYLDEGSVQVGATRNVVEDARWWLSLWTTSIQGNRVTGNWATADVAYCLGTTAPTAACAFAGNEVAGNAFGTPFPPAAEAIRAAAGLEPAFADLAPPP